MPDERTITLQISDHAAETLDDIATSTGRTVSEVVTISTYVYLAALRAAAIREEIEAEDA